MLHPLRPLGLGKHPENVLHHAERVERATLSARFRKRPRYSFGACFRICAGISWLLVAVLMGLEKHSWLS